LRAASIASRPVLSSPKSSTRLLSTRAILPSRPQVSSFVFQRRFNTEDAKREAIETGAETVHEPFVEEATSTSAAEQDSAIDRAPSNKESVGSPLSWAVEPNNSIYVGNLFFDAKEEDIRDFFEKYGEVSKITLVKDVRGYSKG
jgi:RNA recognition motif. (a.k.a. RRM, RBD, or RNP domain)